MCGMAPEPECDLDEWAKALAFLLLFSSFLFLLVGARRTTHLEIRRGQAPEVCAGKPDLLHPEPHWHSATFFFDLFGGLEAGDELTVTLNSRYRASYPALDSTTATLTFPAGLGRHQVHAEWTRGGTMLGVAESSLGVFSCEGG